MVFPQGCQFRLIKLSQVLFWLLMPAIVAGIDTSPTFLSSELIKDFLNKQVPGGIYAEYSCPIVGAFSFDGKSQCAVSCRDYNAEIFFIDNVRKAYISRSADRVALAIDSFSDGSSVDSATDSLASFAATVSCVFTALSPEFDKTEP